MVLALEHQVVIDACRDRGNIRQAGRNIDLALEVSSPADDTAFHDRGLCRGKPAQRQLYCQHGKHQDAYKLE
jgi:hypothetical protein